MAEQEVHSAADIVSLIRATNNGEFALSGQEAELLVNLFASVAACNAGVETTRQIGQHIDNIFSGASS